MEPSGKKFHINFLFYIIYIYICNFRTILLSYYPRTHFILSFFVCRFLSLHNTPPDGKMCFVPILFLARQNGDPNIFSSRLKPQIFLLLPLDFPFSIFLFSSHILFCFSLVFISIRLFFSIILIIVYGPNTERNQTKPTRFCYCVGRVSISCPAQTFFALIYPFCEC